MAVTAQFVTRSGQRANLLTAEVVHIANRRGWNEKNRPESKPLQDRRGQCPVISGSIIERDEKIARPIRPLGKSSYGCRFESFRKDQPKLLLQNVGRNVIEIPTRFRRRKDNPVIRENQHRRRDIRFPMLAPRENVFSARGCLIRPLPLMPRDNDYDVICVGSSPLSLLESLHHDRLGRRVLVVESTPELGGAWGEMKVFGLRRAENAPHVIMFNRTTYDFLARDLGLKMGPMLPPPRYVVRTRFGLWWLSYLLSPFLAYLTIPLHYLTNKHYRKDFKYIREEYFGRLGDAPRQLWMWMKGLLIAGQKPAIEYPEGGTLALSRTSPSQQSRSSDLRGSCPDRTIEGGPLACAS
jgi:hypothetical protein